jgi:molybdopterin molybdotransferase
MTRITNTESGMGLQEALEVMLARVHPLAAVQVLLSEGFDRTLALDIRARVDSPSMDASLMDGYAVRSSDLSGATKDRPVALTLSGTTAAGSQSGLVVESRHTVRVMTGAPIPYGADAVVPEEFTKRQNDLILFYRAEESGGNILTHGNDVAIGQVVARAGCSIGPGLLGLLAAAGHSHVEVIRPPQVAMIATGDEVVAPGNPLPKGKLYASNITTLDGWCRRYYFQTRLYVVGDVLEDICRILKQAIDKADVVITSGGAWVGDKDLMVQALERLEWKEVFHGIRMAPGKGTGFGLIDSKPVFILPGGPPANLVGFLQIGLPGLLRMAGSGYTGLPEINVQLGSDLYGRHTTWTQFVFGTLERQSSLPLFHPLLTRSRLQSLAEAEAIVTIPEGEKRIGAGTIVKAQLLSNKQQAL